MSGLARWFPFSCSRLRVFVCYAHEDKKLAEEIAQALTNDGHNVFIDTNRLTVAGDYNDVIRHAIERADRFIFLISRASVGQGKYPLTELSFAQSKWPSARGTVWPILVDSLVAVDTLPAYLRSVHIHSVKGNAAAEIAADIEKTRTVKPRCFVAAAAALGLLLVIAGFVVSSALDWMAPDKFTLLPPQQIDFRPAKKPGPDQSWQQSRLAITVIPIQYSNDGDRQVRIMNETVLVKLKDRLTPFKWHNEVEMKADCGANWLCTKKSVGTDTLESNGTLRRETMFMPAPGEQITWQDFLDAVCQSKDDRLDVSIKGEGRTTNLFGSSSHMRTAVCQIDLKTMRQGLERLDCKKGMKQIPVRLSPVCINP